jgi:hypothetical protein
MVSSRGETKKGAPFEKKSCLPQKAVQNNTNTYHK